MSSNPSIDSIEANEYDNYYSDFDDDYYMSDDDEDDDDDDDDDDDNNNYNFFGALIPLQTFDPPFLECRKLKEFLNDGTFSDVIIKVEEKKYNLHRVVLSLRSTYFQKLFARNFIEHDQKEIELKSVEVSIFDCIVTYIYENDLESFITSENMTKLLIALDYLQIEIDQTWFLHFIQYNSEVQMVDLFELFNFLVFHSAYPWLLTALLKHFSKNLIKLGQTEYFTSIPFEYLKKILLCMQMKSDEDEERRLIAKICAKWICSDIVDRSGHFVEIVNALKYRYLKLFPISSETYKINCMDRDNKEQYIEKTLKELVLQNYSVEFIPGAVADSFKIRNEESAFGPKSDVNYKQLMKELLNSGDLSDTVIKVSNKSFPVHRVVLASKSSYFHDLFTSNMNENFNEFVIENMDEMTFDFVLKYMYCEEMDITSNENVIFLIKASERFELKEVFTKVEKHVLKKISDVRNIFELFSYLRNSTYTKLLTHTEKYILDNWSKLTEMQDFAHVSIDTLENILSLSNVFAQDELEILNLCSKWIRHDIDNRLRLIPSLIPSLSRSMITSVDCQSRIENIKNNLSEELILNNLTQLLSTLNPVDAIKSQSKSYSYKKPQFMASSGNKLHFFSCNDSKNLHELEDLRLVLPEESINISGACATILDSNLFVHFNDNYFYVQNLVTKRCVSLTSDQVNNQPWRSQLLSCNNSVYLCHNDQAKVLKYSTTLNRWLKVPPISTSSKKNTQCIFASNNKNLFSISTEGHDRAFAVHKYDDRSRSWISLPDIIEMNQAYDHPVSACFSNHDLFVAFGWSSKRYSFQNSKWTTVSYGSTELRTFLRIAPCQNHIIYFVDKNKIVAYNIYKKSWTEVCGNNDTDKLDYFNIVH